MTYEDNNKQRREQQRRYLQNLGWQAVPALKGNGAWQWKWIHPSRKKAYSREEAVKLESKRKRRTVNA